MESSIAVANYFINKTFSGTEELTPMKILKLVYLAHGWNLGLTGEPLLPERVEAWKYGPVIRRVYDAFKSYRNSPIDSMAIDPISNSYQLPSGEVTDLLDKIWEVYKDYTGIQLSTLTHEKGSPWDITWNEQGGKDRNEAVIANDLIADYYRKKAKG